MSNSCKMRPPYYILINDKDFEHLKFYHDYNYKNIHYENEFGDHSAETEVYTKKYPRPIHIGPRRMRYIETALKFRTKIAKIKELPESDLKIVQVEKSLARTVDKIKKGSLEAIPFEGVYK